MRDEWSLGIIIAMSWKAVPFMALIIAGSVANIPEDLKAAARTLGAGRLPPSRVELPLALSGITAATLLVFVASTGAFAVPYLLGPIYPKPLSVWMYEEALPEEQLGACFGDGHPPVGGRLRRPRPLLPADHRHAPRLRRRGAMTTLVSATEELARPRRPGGRPRPPRSGCRSASMWPSPSRLFAPLVVAFLWSMVDPKAGWFAPDILPRSLSLTHWEAALNDRGLVKSIVTSLFISAVVMALSAVLAPPTAYALAKIPFRTKRAIEMFILAPLIVPGLIVGIGIGYVFFKVGLAFHHPRRRFSPRPSVPSRL